MENVRCRSNVKIVNEKNERKLLGLISQPNLKSVYRYENSDLVSLNMGKSFATFNKTIYLGQAILDISKSLMYNFHYKYIRDKYGDRARLLMTDTDSLCYEIQTEDFYDDIRDDVPTMFHTSDYPANNSAGLPVINKKVLGLFKDECQFKQMIEFVGLRPKLYALKSRTIQQQGKSVKVLKKVL